MRKIKSILIGVVLILPFINIFADVLPKQSFKGQLVIVQELKINNDTVKLGVSSEGQLLRYDGMKYTNWTPDFDSLYNIDSVKYLRGRIQIYQAGNIDSTEVLTVDTTQVLNLQQFVKNNEIDSKYSNDSSFIKSGVRDWNSSVSKLITAEDTIYWNSKLDIELDPIYSNDSIFLNSGVRDWNNSLAKTIDITDTTWWGRAEIDPQYAADSANIVKYVGNDRDLDLGNNSIIADSSFFNRVSTTQIKVGSGATITRSGTIASKDIWTGTAAEFAANTAKDGITPQASTTIAFILD